jgi:hypothetical protein
MAVIQETKTYLTSFGASKVSLLGVGALPSMIDHLTQVVAVRNDRGSFGLSICNFWTVLVIFDSLLYGLI